MMCSDSRIYFAQAQVTYMFGSDSRICLLTATYIFCFIFDRTNSVTAVGQAPYYSTYSNRNKCWYFADYILNTFSINNLSASQFGNEHRTDFELAHTTKSRPSGRAVWFYSEMFGIIGLKCIKLLVVCIECCACCLRRCRHMSFANYCMYRCTSVNHFILIE